MSDEPKFPLPPAEMPSVIPVQQPPQFGTAPVAPTAPGIPSMMPGYPAPPFAAPVYPAQMAAPPFAPPPVAPAYAGHYAPPQAPPAPAAPQGPVLGVRDFYQFGEEPVGQRVQVTILETPAMPPELPPPSKIDPGLEATRVALEAQLARNAIAALPYVPPTATRWFRFAPLELFMEHVLARRLWTVE